MFYSRPGRTSVMSAITARFATPEELELVSNSIHGSNLFEGKVRR